MRILIISYDLKGTQNYQPLYDAIKLQGQWWHYLTSTWLVYTVKTPEQVYNSICSHILQNDRLFVGTISNGYEGWLAKEAWDWIKARGVSSR